MQSLYFELHRQWRQYDFCLLNSGLLVFDPQPAREAVRASLSQCLAAKKNKKCGTIRQSHFARRLTHVLITQSGRPQQMQANNAHARWKAGASGVSAAAPLISHPLLQRVWPGAPSGGMGRWLCKTAEKGGRGGVGCGTFRHSMD